MTETPSATPPRLAGQLPEPGRFWIRYAPRAWPAPEGPWLDLARGALGASDPEAAVAAEGRLDDLLYLPPVAPERAAERDRLAGERLAEGTPVLVQLLPGDPPGPAGTTAVYDLLPALVAGDLGALAGLPAGAAAAWPLVAGLTDDPALWRRGCEVLAGAGVACLQPVLPTLSPAERRRLSEGLGEEAFHALFHRPPPEERDFPRVAARAGLAVFLERPLPRPPLAGAANRRLAGLLVLAAELWLSLGRPVGPGLALARAGRWVDASTYDVAALAREGNLGVVAEVDEGSRRRIEEWAEHGRLALLDELLAEYTAPAT